MKKLFIYLVCLGLLMPGFSEAAQFVVKERAVITTNDVDDDLYAAGESVSVVNKVNKDLFAAGQKVEVEEEVAQDVVAVGQLVRVRGAVGDDVYAAGEDVELNAPEVDDVFMAGSTVTIAQKTNVKGDVYAAGQKVTIMGRVEGTVRVAGDVVVVDGAVINGDLITRGPKEPIIEGGATVVGNSRHIEDKGADKPSAGVSVGMWVQSVVSWFIFGWLLIYLFRKRVKEVVDTAFTKGGKSLGWGFLWILLFLPSVILAMVLVVGIPIGIVILLETFLVIILGMVAAPILVGVWLDKKLLKRENQDLNWQQVLMGVIVYKIVGLIPVVGWLVVMVITVLAMGAWIQVGWRMLRGSNQTNAPVPEVV
jgi:hypothetical protein